MSNASASVLFATGGPVNLVRPLLPAEIASLPLKRQRAKLWELNESVHCSIVGTCLTTGELRRAMGKVLQADVAGMTDHDLHSQAVGWCNRQNAASKLLQKTLDHRHETVVKRITRIHGEEAVLEAWAQARRSGDIPGAYWAVLTHPDVGLCGLRRAFGDVHMLSHLVGAANRADIRRLTALEETNAALLAKVERQQLRLQEAITSRDATIRRLGALASVQTEARSDVADNDALAGLRHLAADLQGRLERETARRERLEQRLADAAETVQGCKRRAEHAEEVAAAVRRELTMLEQLETAAPEMALPASRILYVGGRPAVVEQISTLLEKAGGALLAHDGGRHDHPSLLPGLVSQAEQVVFPVDCVSHDAALTVKRLCRQSGKRFLPLRSSGLASFLAALVDRSPQSTEVAP